MLGFSRHSPFPRILALALTPVLHIRLPLDFCLAKKIGSNANRVRGAKGQKKKGSNMGRQGELGRSGGICTLECSDRWDNDMPSESSMVPSRVVIIRKLRAIVAKVPPPLRPPWVNYGDAEYGSLGVLWEQPATQSRQQRKGGDRHDLSANFEATDIWDYEMMNLSCAILAYSQTRPKRGEDHRRTGEKI
ncbi:hypothetical protein BO85DRAFT_277225 [Aspergillus piperis CBS 112811]|uniref:Uncharacterized protein n=1 Tax=Aspergillus piperis CBS 112811 TaxID=1448313 RepID=A0A8G1R5G4_9EURO|nr:hypothetical protein BO85DRAFT_277225 [Aspergillus piperis CBS 112811]RAH58589.1 hypothetical protein BO85DRAFT_277225 [Aspergillus piperis CBS 112811]